MIDDHQCFIFQIKIFFVYKKVACFTYGIISISRESFLFSFGNFFFEIRMRKNKPFFLIFNIFIFFLDRVELRRKFYESY